MASFSSRYVLNFFPTLNVSSTESFISALLISPTSSSLLYPSVSSQSLFSSLLYPSVSSPSLFHQLHLHFYILPYHRNHYFLHYYIFPCHRNHYFINFIFITISFRIIAIIIFFITISFRVIAIIISPTSSSLLYPSVSSQSLFHQLHLHFYILPYHRNHYFTNFIFIAISFRIIAIIISPTSSSLLYPSVSSQSLFHQLHLHFYILPYHRNHYFTNFIFIAISFRIIAIIIFFITISFRSIAIIISPTSSSFLYPSVSSPSLFSSLLYLSVSSQSLFHQLHLHYYIFPYHRNHYFLHYYIFP